MGEEAADRALAGCGDVPPFRGQRLTVERVSRVGNGDELRKPQYATGSTGLGKTHLARALGYAQCQRGHRVLFTALPALVNRFSAAEATKSLHQALKGYQRKPTIITTNRAFGEWSQIFAGDAVATRSWSFSNKGTRRHTAVLPTVDA